MCSGPQTAEVTVCTRIEKTRTLVNGASGSGGGAVNLPRATREETVKRIPRTKSPANQINAMTRRARDPREGVMNLPMTTTMMMMMMREMMRKMGPIGRNFR